MQGKSSYKAFVSSTFADLKDHRAHVIRQLRKAGISVDPMEDWTANNDEPKQFSQDRLEGCDLCILLVAYRRGFVPEGETRSITQLEYEAAVKRGIEVWPFLLAEESPWVARFDERRDDKEFVEWRSHLQKKHGVEWFALEPTSLDVMGAVARWLAKEKGMEPGAPEKVYWPEGKSPYPGLFHFTRQYASVFFGRKAEVQEILDRMQCEEGRFMIISGDSGVGKSSVVDAGVLPKVEDAGLSGERCLGVRMVPSQRYQPFDTLLRDALGGLINRAGLRSDVLLEEISHAPDTLGRHLMTIMKHTEENGASTLLLFLDQMEELFTSQDLDQATSFLSALYQATQEKAMRLIGTIRSDHLHYCHRHPDMVKVLNSIGHYAIGPVKPYMMEDMIRKPAQATGLELSEPFAKRLIHDTEAASANLPLLAFVLEQLYRKRMNHELSEKVYDELGGISGAIATHVTKVEATIQKNLRVKPAEVLPPLFHTLVNVQKEEGIPTRNRKKKGNFPKELHSVIDRLVTERLLRTEGQGEDATISISHEKLFDAWPALKDYVDIHKKELVDRTLLDSRAKRWDKRGRPWFRGLVIGLEYYDFQRAGSNAGGLTQEFFQASRRARYIWMAGGLVVMLLMGGITWLLQKGYNLEQAGLKVQSLFVSIHVPPEMVPIPGGTFCQGDVEGFGEGWGKPVREVMIKPFAMGKHEVTFEEYDAFAIATGREMPNHQDWGRGQRPVINVSWKEARDYADWLSRQTGQGYRLPTESEWEYAARSGDKQQTWAGTSEDRELENYAVYKANSGNRTAKVGSKQPNVFGLYDLSGNVFEWVEDCVHGDNEGAPKDGSAWLESEEGNCTQRVVRGGSWLSKSVYILSSNRDGNYSDWQNYNIGFRLAQDIS